MAWRNLRSAAALRSRTLPQAGTLAAALLLAAAAAAEQDPLLEASALLERGAAREAAAMLQEYVAAHPSDADGYRLWGVALALVPQRSAALQALNRAVALQPENAASRLALGQALARFGENEPARAAFRTALELEPALGPAHEGLALSLAFDSELDAAERHFTAALASSRAQADSARLHYLRGKARAQLGRTETAGNDFAAAVRLAPGLAPAYLEWGRMLAGGPQTAQAESVLRKAAQLLPGNFEAQYLLGAQLLGNGKAAAALGALRRATELNPGDRPAAYALGRALRAAGKAEEARRVLAAIARAGASRAVDEADINEAGRLNNLGLDLEARGDYEAALANYEAAAAIAPENVQFRRNAALVLGRLNRWEEAKALLREVLRAAPGDVDATKALYIALEHAPDKP